MRLARRPEDINLAAVIKDCEETTTVIECLAADYKGDCPLMPQCELRSILREARKAFLAYLEKFSLQDLVANRHVRQTLQPVRIVEAQR
jgi:Rrf2 family nitric oxide-sensitive transcriptional repressor